MFSAFFVSRAISRKPRVKSFHLYVALKSEDFVEGVSSSSLAVFVSDSSTCAQEDVDLAL